jgi:hypothetical protein
MWVDGDGLGWVGSLSIFNCAPRNQPLEINDQPKPLEMNHIANNLLGLVCGFLSARETVNVLTRLSRALRRSGVKVSWSVVDLQDPGACIAACELGNLSQLETVTVRVTVDANILAVHSLTQNAKRITFSMTDNWQVERLSTVVYRQATSLSLLSPNELGGGLLRPFFACFPELGDLDVCLGSRTLTYLSKALRDLPRLRRLAVYVVSPAYGAEAELLEAVASLSHLTSLTLKLPELTLDLAMLKRLERLETCSLAIESVSIAQCLSDMASLRSLTLRVCGNQRGQVLTLPCGVQEFVFVCKGWFSPSVLFGSSSLVTLTLCARSTVAAMDRAPRALDQLESLTTEVDFSDVLPLLHVLPTLQKLRTLSLEMDDRAADLMSEAVLMAQDKVRLRVATLALAGHIATHAPWLEAFPDAVQLDIEVRGALARPDDRSLTSVH